nr:hypothetical protein [Candidatus Hydrogenedentota bacterium]
MGSICTHVPAGGLWKALLPAILCLALFAPGARAEIVGEPACPAWTFLVNEGWLLFPAVGIADFNTADINSNAMFDKLELAPLEAVLCNEALPQHAEVRAYYQAVLAQVRAESTYAATLQPFENALTAFIMIDQYTADQLKSRLGLEGSYAAYTAGKMANEPFSWSGNYDGDASVNYCEYQRVVDEAGGRIQYAEYATNPAEPGQAGCDPFRVPDYCTIVDQIASNGLLRGLLDEEDAALLNKLFCKGSDVYCAEHPEAAFCPISPPEPSPDINGGIDEVAQLPLPNGMYDVEYELGLIRAVLQDPSFDLSSGSAPGQVRPGVTYDITMQGLHVNRTRLYADVGPDALALLEAFGLGYLADGLVDLMSSFLILGDDLSSGSVIFLFGLIGEYAANPNPDPRSFVNLPTYYAWFGDADGDGYCNRLEYDAFYDAGDPSLYVTAALDPTIVPPGTDECPDQAFVFSDAYVYRPEDRHVFRNSLVPGTGDGCQMYAQTHYIGKLDRVYIPGNLITIRSAEENQWPFDHGLVSDTRMIGLHDPDLDNANYEWYSGEPVTYTNWRDGEPNNLDEPWVELRTDGFWNDDNNTRFGIIEFVPPCDDAYYDLDEDGVPDEWEDNDGDGVPDGFLPDGTPITCI